MLVTSLLFIQIVLYVSRQRLIDPMYDQGPSEICGAIEANWASGSWLLGLI